MSPALHNIETDLTDLLKLVESVPRLLSPKALKMKHFCLKHVQKDIFDIEANSDNGCVS